jgi:hypothetical protein
VAGEWLRTDRSLDAEKRAFSAPFARFLRGVAFSEKLEYALE